MKLTPVSVHFFQMSKVAVRNNFKYILISHFQDVSRSYVTILNLKSSPSYTSDILCSIYWYPCITLKSGLQNEAIPSLLISWNRTTGSVISTQTFQLKNNRYAASSLRIFIDRSSLGTFSLLSSPFPRSDGPKHFSLWPLTALTRNYLSIWCTVLISVTSAVSSVKYSNTSLLKCKKQCPFCRLSGHIV
jgi:hypothetical protein